MPPPSCEVKKNPPLPSSGRNRPLKGNPLGDVAASWMEGGGYGAVLGAGVRGALDARTKNRYYILCAASALDGFG